MARRTYVREGFTLRPTLGGYSATISGTLFTFRKKDDGTWRSAGQVHKAQPLSDLCTLTDCVLWAKGHVRHCDGGCTATSGPFDSLRGKINVGNNQVPGG